MADALASGASARKGVWVQVPSRAPRLLKKGPRYWGPFLYRGQKKPAFMNVGQFHPDSVNFIRVRVSAWLYIV